MTFQVGDVVVCVDASPRRGEYFEAFWAEYLSYVSALKHRGIYRVAAVNYWDKWDEGPGFVLSIAGAPSMPDPDFPDMPDGWDPERFRPVTKADEQFTAQIRACRDAHSPAPVA